MLLGFGGEIGWERAMEEFEAGGGFYNAWKREGRDAKRRKDERRCEE